MNIIYVEGRGGKIPLLCLLVSVLTVLLVMVDFPVGPLSHDRTVAQYGQLIFESDDYRIKDGTGPYVVGRVAYLFAGDDPWMPPGENSKLVALNAENGSLVWQRELEWAGGMGSKARPLVEAGRVYIGCGESVYCLDAANGNILWSTTITPPGGTTDSVIIADPVMYATDTGTKVVVVGDYIYGCYLGLDMEDGDILWTYDLDANCSAIGAPGMDEDGKRLYLPQHTSFGFPANGKIHCLDISGSTPVKLWEYSTDFDVAGSPAFHEGMLYFSDFAYGGPKSYLYCLEDKGNAASLLWRQEIWGSSGTPLVDINNETLYVCGNDYSVGGNHFYAFALLTGNLLWDNPNWGAYNGNCALSPTTGYLYAGSFDVGAWAHNKGLAAMDPDTGSELWYVTSKGGGDPVVVDGVVYTTADGRLYAYHEYRPSQYDWYFAEGYTGEGFEEWLTLANPGEGPGDDAVATVTYIFNGGREPITVPYPVPAGTRRTICVNEAVGEGMEVSIKVVSDKPLVAERPMYFDYRMAGNRSCTGGHCVVGADSPAQEWYFAEGYTGEGFEEWLTLANFEEQLTRVDVTYIFKAGLPVSKRYEVPARRRLTINVNQESGVKGDVSIKVSSPDKPLVAERPMYFDYRVAGTLTCSGGHCVVGATESGTKWCFAEGYTGPGFDQWLTLANTGSEAATVEVTYLYQNDDPETRKYVLEANQRNTVFLNGETGTGKEFGLVVNSSAPILAERVSYFSGYRGTWDDGLCVVGAPMPSTFWCLAEGYTSPRFDEYICISNPGKDDAWVTCAPLFGGGETIQLVVRAGKRSTIGLRGGTPVERAYALYSDRGVVVERAMYFSYQRSAANAWEGGHCTMGATLKEIY